jgi:hypothetical protein
MVHLHFVVFDTDKRQSSLFFQPKTVRMLLNPSPSPSSSHTLSLTCLSNFDKSLRILSSPSAQSILQPLLSYWDGAIFSTYTWQWGVWGSLLGQIGALPMPLRQVDTAQVLPWRSMCSTYGPNLQVSGLFSREMTCVLLISSDSQLIWLQNTSCLQDDNRHKQ